MIDLKKKCWREKVTAEITVAHVQQFVHEMGANMTDAEVALFLNENGRAQSVWIHMMQAGERYIKSSLQTRAMGIPAVDRPGVRVTMVQ
jgi:hypothetical protein